MTTLTLNQIEQRQLELQALIDKYKEQHQNEVTQQPALPTLQDQGRVIRLDSRLTIKSGERYAGLILSKDGTPQYHLILLLKEVENVTWEQASKGIGDLLQGDLPSPEEQSLLRANLNDYFEDTWYWSSQEFEEKSLFAWGQHFKHGLQYYDRKTMKYRAKYVRRVSYTYPRGGA